LNMDYSPIPQPSVGAKMP